MPLVAVELLVAVAIGFAMQNSAVQDARSTATHVLRLQAEGLAATRSDEAPLPPDTPWGVARVTVVEPTASGEGLTVGVVTSDSRVPTEALPAMDDQLNRPEIAAAIQTGRGSSIRRSVTVGQRLLYAAARVPNGPRAGCVLRLAVPVDRVDQTAEPPIGTLIGGMAVLVLVTVTLLGVVDRRRATDASLLAQAAIDLGHGRPARRISDEDAAADLQPVVRALNAMSEDVQRRIEELELSENEMQGILQSMSNGVLALDLHHRILNLNRAAETMLGLNRVTCRGDLLNAHVRDPALSAFIDESLKLARHHMAELDLQAIGGKCLEIVAEPLHNQSGHVMGVLLVFSDMTRVRMLEQIRTDFASNVSHELRTPITAIRGYAEVLAEHLADPTLEKYVRVIEKNATRLSAIIEDLLALARLEQSEETELDHSLVDLPGLAEDVASMLRPLAEERSITLAVDAAEVTPVDGNRQLLEQALVNLVTNAIRYSGETASVWISIAGASPGEVELSVIDTGPGIERVHLERLFERFYRVDRGRSRREGGTGLGLAIVKHIALVHGGRVEVESRVGVGSIFTVVLPADAPEAGPASDIGHLPDSNTI